jgi:peptide/nickel transport system substrate-binding protein
MKKGWRALALSLILILPSVAVSCNLAVPPSTPDGAIPQATDGASLSEGKLLYGLTLSPSGIDPHINASSELGIALTSVYDTLVYRALAGDSGAQGQFVPGLAESWQVSDDGLTYTFHLRHDVTFQDGTPFNAEAVRVNIERVLDPNLQSQKAVYLLGPVESVEVIDEYTVALHLSAPYAPLLDGLAQVYLGMASPAALAKWGADYQFHQVGTGPFKFVEYVPNDHLTLVRNDGYNWGPSIYDHSGPAYLQEIEFRFFTDPAGRALALEAGDVHVMGEVPPLDAIRLRDDARFQVIPVTVPGQPLGFMLNTQQPPLDDVRIRQALIFATDRDAMVQAIFGGQSPPAVGPLTAATLGYDPSLAGLYPYSPDKAAALLQQAGWVDSDGDGTRDQDGQALFLKAALMTWGSVPEVAQLLQAQWAQVGINLRTEVLTYPAALQVARKGTYHIMPQNYSGSDPDQLWTYYHSGEPFNWSKVSDPDLDGLLDQARSTFDPAQRTRLYQQAQQRIMQQALLIPIRDPVNLNAASAQVQNLRFDAHGWFPLLHDVSLSPPPRG